MSFLFFPRPSVTVLCSFGLPALLLAILSWKRAGLRLLPRPTFLFCSFPIYKNLDWFLLICSSFSFYILLPLSVCPCPLLHKWVLVSPGSARVVFTMQQHWATTCHPSYCFSFVFTQLLIIHCTLFPFSFSHFDQADVFPCLATEPIRIFPSRNVCLQSCTDYHTPPPSQLRASTLSAGTTILIACLCPLFPV
jgi:hypothetical protein